MFHVLAGQAEAVEGFDDQLADLASMASTLFCTFWVTADWISAALAIWVFMY